MADESIILAVELDTKKALTQFDLLAQSIEDAKKRQDELNQQFKEGAITTEEYNKATKENTKEIKAAETATKSLTTAIKSEANSINDLRAQNRELEKQRNALGILNDSNKDKFKALNDQINRNNDLIKANVSGLEQQKINIGNYSSALDGIVPGFSGFIGGIQGATRASLAFIATPLGAALAAIALALAAFSNYLKTTGEGEDLVAEKTASLNAALKLFSNYLNEIISFLLDADGSFEKLNKRFGALSYTLYLAYKPLQLLITGLTALAKLAPGYEAGKQLAQDLDQASDAAGLLALKQKDVRNEIDLLLLKAQDKKISDEQRAAFLDEALNKEIELNKEITAQKQEDLRLGLEQIKQDNLRAFTSIDTAKKTNEEIANLLLNNGQITDDQRERIQDLLGAIKDNANESIQLQQKILNKENQAAEERKQKLEAQKQDAEKRKAEQEKELARLTELQRIKESFAQAEKNRISDLNQYKIDSQNEISKNIKEITKNNEEELTEIVKEQLEKRTELAEKNALERELAENKAKIAIEKAAFDTLGFITDTVGRANQKRIISYQKLFNEGKITEEKLNELSKESSKRYRALALAEIAAGVGVGFIQGLNIAQQSAKGTGPAAALAFPIFYASQISAVLAAAAKARAVIDSTSFSGGSSVSGGGISSSSGRSGVTATQATTNPINQTFSAANAFRNMPPVIASWQEATTVRNRVEFKEALTTV